MKLKFYNVFEFLVMQTLILAAIIIIVRYENIFELVIGIEAAILASYLCIAILWRNGFRPKKKVNEDSQ